MKSIGLALGGGGARGLAHIRFLEILDDLQIKPTIVAGCSMGAIVGALYASGCSGREIRKLVEDHSLQSGGSFRNLSKRVLNILRVLARMLPKKKRGGVVNVDRLLGYMLEPLQGKTFGDLPIPLVVVATDFWKAEEVVFKEGEVMSAVQASLSIPGLFAPCQHEGRVLVDGGLVNELPFNHILNRCDLTIGISVAGERHAKDEQIPSSLEASAGAIEILQRTLLEEKLKSFAPDLLVCPRLRNIELLDFLKVGEIFEQCDSSVDEFRSDLERLEVIPDRGASPEEPSRSGLNDEK